ncbi:ABC transporter ATP-binding protein [Paenibacillus sp. GXUN7292]|uniref:ABC transporter ATP-binding protein n=1 Tax=Paenibacillus sp. GXUN7292 TaxID=3422499 RepID=UPI003D7D0D0E
MLKNLTDPFKYPKPEVVFKTTEAGEVKNASQQNADKITAAGKSAKRKRPEKSKQTLQRIWSYLIEHKVRLFAVLIMILLSSVLSIAGPYLIGVAIDRYIMEHSSGFVLFLVGLAAVYILQSVVLWFQNIWMISISQQTVFKMRKELFSKFHKLSIPYFSKRQHGELMSRMTNDIENVSNSLNSSVVQIFSSGLLLIGIAVVMISISPLLTLLSFIIVPLLFLGMKWITNRTSRMFKTQQCNLGDINGYVEETLSGQRIVKLFSQEQNVIDHFKERNERIRVSGFWAQAISGFIPKLMNGLNNLSFALIAGVGAILVINGHGITVGVIIMFAEYSRQFTRPLNDLANQWNTLLSAIAGAERVFEVLDEPEENDDEADAKALSEIKGHVEFDNVCFAYEENNPLIHNISFHAAEGEMIALVGPTGAGKSTLIHLLARFYNPTKGAIKIDGVDIRLVTRESMRSHMAYVMQDPYLFEGTIYENIVYGRMDASEEQVVQAARLANADSFIRRLPGGYHTRLKLGGDGISQGQKQLLAIARAILADPKILVLDEATSNIDTFTEIKIQEALQRLMKGRTCFVIAHRLNTIKHADRIVVIQAGTIVEQGSHEQLLKAKGYYYGLIHGAEKNSEAM